MQCVTYLGIWLVEKSIFYFSSSLYCILRFQSQDWNSQQTLMLTVNFLYKVFHKTHAVSFCNHGAKEITSTNNIETNIQTTSGFAETKLPQSNPSLAHKMSGAFSFLFGSEVWDWRTVISVGFHLFAVDWMVINQFSFQLQIKFYPSFKSRKNLSFIFLVSWVFFVTVKSPSQL